jgi:WD40 repeat protein
VTINEQGELRFLGPHAEVLRVSQIQGLGGGTAEPSLAWSPNGKEIAISGTGGITVVEAADPAANNRGSARSPVSDHVGENTLAIDPERSHLLLTGIGQPQARFCNLLTGSAIEVPTEILRSPMDDHHFSPNGRQIACLLDNTRLSVWNAEKGTTDVVTRAEGGLRAAAWSPLDDRIAYCDDEETIHVVKLDGKQVAELRPKQPPQARQLQKQTVVQLLWSDDAQAIIVRKATLVEIRLLDGTDGASFDFGGPFARFWISADLRQAAAWTRNGRKETFKRCRGGEGAKEISDVPGDVECCDFSRDLTRFLAGRDSGEWEMRRLDDPSAEPQQVRAHANGSCMTTVFSPNGQRFATGGWDAVVKIWRMDGTVERTLYGNTHPIYKVWWSRDGKRLVSSSRNGTFCRWSVDDGRLETMTIVVDGGKLLRIPGDGRFPSADVEVAAKEFLVLLEKPNGSMEIVEYPEFLKRRAAATSH